MNFKETMLNHAAPQTLKEVLVSLPRREQYYQSPVDWRNEVLYFLLPDRFSDEGEKDRKLLDWQNPKNSRPANWSWDKWAKSGSDRWQGGTIKGIGSKLDYLKKLGVTTLWIGPLFKQRVELNTYHGYGVQDFLDIDARFGDRQDLVALVDKAHSMGMRIILDIIFNHSGSNFIYPSGKKSQLCDRRAIPQCQPDYKVFPEYYQEIEWIDQNGEPTGAKNNRNDAVWPQELQNEDYYSRAGTACDIGWGDIFQEHEVHKRTDFEDLRDFNVTKAFNDLALCYKYWIALTDCDGFRIDTLKHVSFSEAKDFCGAIKEFATNLGKSNFFLVGEVAGGDYAEEHYIHALKQNLNAVLDIGEMRPVLEAVAKGLLPAVEYFDGFEIGKRSVMGSHRQLGNMHVSILNDHDHVFGDKIRFSVNAAGPHQVVAGVALQLLTLGIPCIYYGTEQALAGPEAEERHWLDNEDWKWARHDRYLREAMFGPDNPRKDSEDIRSESKFDTKLPGFGPFGTAGYHCFNEEHPAYVRIATIAALRRKYPALRSGRQYLRRITLKNPSSSEDFTSPDKGELIAWSRILADEEFLCIVNSHGTENRGAKIIVDANLVSKDQKMWLLLNTADLNFSGAKPVDVKRTSDGTAYVEIENVPPSEVLVLTNILNYM